MSTEGPEGMPSDPDLDLRDAIETHGALFAHQWEEDLQRLVGKRLPSLNSLVEDAEREMGSRPSHEQALRAVINNYVGADLGETEYLLELPEILEFVAAALASGVIGNLSYDALKRGWAANASRRKARAIDSRNLDLIARVAVQQYLHEVSIEVALSEIKVIGRSGTPTELHLALRTSNPTRTAKLTIPLRAPEGDIDHQLVVQIESTDPGDIAQMALQEYARLKQSSLDFFAKPRELKAVQKAVEILQLRHQDRSDENSVSRSGCRGRRDDYLSLMNTEALRLAWEEGLDTTLRQVLLVESPEAHENCLAGFSGRDVVDEFVRAREPDSWEERIRKGEIERVIKLALAIHDGTLALVNGTYYDRLPDSKLQYSGLNRWRRPRRSPGPETGPSE